MYKRQNPDKPEPDYSGIIKALKEICDYANEKNVEIWVETHNEFATGKVLKPLIEDVGKSNLKIIWDVIHPIEDGESIEETWSEVGKSIAHIHIKDGINRHDPESVSYTHLDVYKRQVYNRTSQPQVFMWWANLAVPVNETYKTIFPPDVEWVNDHDRRCTMSWPIAKGVYHTARPFDYGDRTDISMYDAVKVPSSFLVSQVQSDMDFVAGYDLSLIHIYAQIQP